MAIWAAQKAVTFHGNDGPDIVQHILKTSGFLEWSVVGLTVGGSKSN